MSTLPSISAPVFRVTPTQGDSQQDLLKGRRSSDEMRLEFDDQKRRAVTEPVLRGEWIESITGDKQYQSLYSENIDPQNRKAISQYQAADASGSQPGSLGHFIDRYI